MRTFYGESAESSSDLLALAQQAAPIVSAFVLPTDPVERKAVIEARIKNLRAMKARFPVAALFYDNEIRKLKAKLSATERSTALAEEQERSRRVFRYLGWTGAGVAIFLGVALTARALRRR